VSITLENLKTSVIYFDLNKLGYSRTSLNVYVEFRQNVTCLKFVVDGLDYDLFGGVLADVEAQLQHLVVGAVGLDEGRVQAVQPGSHLAAARASVTVVCRAR